ncbi:MAG: porin family protein [Deltaproteobacteria bacterium]|nr:porin family protein [Deltaproteobacteria bacterium]MBW1916326.1 porin family protein [Deltaproteobacteria bacterium]
MKKMLVVLISGVLLVLSSNVAMASSIRPGTMELGGYASFQTMSFDGGGSVDVNTLLVTGGQFIKEDVQVGGALMYMTADGGGSSADAQMIDAYVKKYFLEAMKSEVTIPYVGAQAGMIFYDAGGDDDTEFSFGAMAGIKHFLSEQTSVNLEYNYRIYSDLKVGTLMVGISYYFNR